MKIDINVSIDTDKDADELVDLVNGLYEIVKLYKAEQSRKQQITKDRGAHDQNFHQRSN